MGPTKTFVFRVDINVQTSIRADHALTEDEAHECLREALGAMAEWVYLGESDYSVSASDGVLIDTVDDFDDDQDPVNT